jgi:hypothetical protein
MDNGEIDISKDNIHNNIDGACARFLNANKKYSKLMSALFVNGDSKLNIRNGDAFPTEKDKQIAKAVFGIGAKDISLLGKGVYKHYGIAEFGFHISSCQFAMHYFFENKTTFHQFIRNITECTKLNGHFIGTCYDGKKVFEILKKKKNGESMTIVKNERKIFEITKMYDQTGFPDDELGLGYPINVYQESINKVFREYLVNFDYFIRIMEDYGFVLVTKEEAIGMNFQDGTGMFNELFNMMELEIKQNPNRKSDYKKAMYMSSQEKQISFMNRYFVFKKVRNVDVKKMYEIIVRQNEFIDRNGEENIKEIERSISDLNKKTNKITKSKKKIILKTYVPIDESPVQETKTTEPEKPEPQPEPIPETQSKPVPEPQSITQSEPEPKKIKLKIKRTLKKKPE